MEIHRARRVDSLIHCKLDEGLGDKGTFGNVEIGKTQSDKLIAISSVLQQFDVAAGEVHRPWTVAVQALFFRIVAGGVDGNAYRGLTYSPMA